jgi:hypothetical protein
MTVGVLSSFFFFLIPLLTSGSLLETERLFGIVTPQRKAKIGHLHIHSLWLQAGSCALPFP